MRATNHGLFQPGQPVPNAYADYAAISSSMLGKGYVRYWDAPASAPYLYNAEKQIFVSYEDPESLALKCKYVNEQHLKGVMFWDYAGRSIGRFAGRDQRRSSSMAPILITELRPDSMRAASTVADTMPDPPQSRGRRIASIDVFRGLTMMVMIFVNELLRYMACPGGPITLMPSKT